MIMHSRTNGERGRKKLPSRPKKFGQNQKFSGSDNELLGKDKVTRFRTIHIKGQKQLRFDVKTFFVSTSFFRRKYRNLKQI